MSMGERIRGAGRDPGSIWESMEDMLGTSTQDASMCEHDETAPGTKKLLAASQVLKLPPDSLMAEGEKWKLKNDHPEQVLERAIAYAAARHSGTFRKGTNIPYITHPMEAAKVVSALTDDEEVIAAAVLHDVLEDTDTDYKELESLFGERIASLVAEESENKRKNESPESTWKIRKQEAIGRLKAAGHEAKLIALGDKLSNIRAIHHDYLVMGDELWERFNQKNKAEIAWYYAGIFQVLDEDEQLTSSPQMCEYAACFDAVFHDVCGPLKS